MTSFQATLVNAGYGQLALRDRNGKLAQKWTLGHPKCVIGAHANCNVRCMLPGVADHHLLLVIGARQIYMRALAAGVEREGVAVNELVMSGEPSQFAFSLAGYRFEYSRHHLATPVAKTFVHEATSLSEPEPASSQKCQDARPSSGRLRFTFVQALEKSRERSEVSSASDAAGSAVAAAGERPAWVEEIVRDALRPVELRLETIAQPINNLERQLRRQRARRRKKQHARRLSQHTAHEVNTSHTEQLIHAQETIQKVIADQSARLELVNQRVSDIVSQLASLERTVSLENDQHQQVVSRTSQSGAEIIRLQREMLALVGALQTQIAQPPASSGEDAQWRASIERQLVELHQSLSILDEIKSSLELAVSQNRELNHDLEARWQRIEEVAHRRAATQPAPIASPDGPLSVNQEFGTSQAPWLRPAIPSAPATESPVSVTESLKVPPPESAATQTLLPWSVPTEPYPAESLTLEAVRLDSLEIESLPLESLAPLASAPLAPTNDQPSEFNARAMGMLAEEQALLEATALETPSTAGDFRVASIASSDDPNPLPSWWADDPVVPSEASRAVNVPTIDMPPGRGPAEDGPAEDGPADSGRADSGPADGGLAVDAPPDSSLPVANVFDDEGSYNAKPQSLSQLSSDLADDAAGAAAWRPTEYDHETAPRRSEQPRPYSPPSYSEAKGDYPDLDMPQLLTSAIADAPAPSNQSPMSYDEQPYSNHTYAEQTFDEQTIDTQHDIRDASGAVSQSTSEIEDQLQQWLTEDYDSAGRNRSFDGERLDGAEVDPTEVAARPIEDEQFFIGGVLAQPSSVPGMFDQPTAFDADTADTNSLDDQDYAVSAFSADRLTIDEASLALVAKESSQPASSYSQEPAHSEREASLTASHELLLEQTAYSSESGTVPDVPAAEEPTSAEGGDESVEEYMRRLLARMRGVSESEVKLPGLDRDESAKPEARPRAPQAIPSTGMLDASSGTETVPQPEIEPFESMKYVPRVSAPEKNRDIDALRELANTSARSAIHVSARRKHGTAIMIKSGVSLVGLAAGAALVSINGLEINIGLVATLASFMVALIWGYDALATLRPLLQASRGAKSQFAKTTAGEPEEEAS